MSKKTIGITILILLIAGAIVGYDYYKAIMSPNTSFSADSYMLKIPSNADFNTVNNILQKEQVIKSHSDFLKTAKIMKYDQAKIKSGLYKIKRGWSNRQLIQALRLGKQSPVKLSFNNIRTLEALAGKLAVYIEPDSISILNQLLSPSTFEKYQLNRETMLSLFIPNTYEIYWNTSPNKLLQKMKSENQKFWEANNRNDKADKLGFTKEQVYTLASIVEKETQANIEKSRIAGVYINRIKRGIPLQADPTVVFALKKFDLKRVLLKHLNVDSPYNTYKHAGLPPGPIYMPSISSIDAVLNPEKHQYIYFCAKPDGSGQHAFAKTLTGHNKNARTYQRWLSSRRIY